MRPAPSSEQVSERMAKLARRDTAPELAVRRELHSMGLRYRVCFPVPGMARRSVDIAFPKQRVAIFVDGCFWHGCKQHFVTPKSNTVWWLEKLQANAIRDLDTDAHLATLGWQVIRIWEHEPVERAVGRVVQAVLEDPGLPRSVG